MLSTKFSKHQTQLQWDRAESISESAGVIPHNPEQLSMVFALKDLIYLKNDAEKCESEISSKLSFLMQKRDFLLKALDEIVLVLEESPDSSKILSDLFKCAENDTIQICRGPPATREIKEKISHERNLFESFKALTQSVKHGYSYGANS